MNYKDLFLGLLVALITGAINGAAVMTVTGFKLDREHLLALGAAAFVGGLLNAAMFLKTPPNANVTGAHPPVEPLAPLAPPKV